MTPGLVMKVLQNHRSCKIEQRAFLEVSQWPYYETHGSLRNGLVFGKIANYLVDRILLRIAVCDFTGSCK